MAINDPIGPSFPGLMDPCHSGAPGSQGADWHESAGPTVGSPIVSVVGVSSQLPEGRPTMSVESGDTSGMSDDQAAHQDVLMAGPASGNLSYTDTGAGHGVCVSASSHNRFDWQQPAK